MSDWIIKLTFALFILGTFITDINVIESQKFTGMSSIESNKVISGSSIYHNLDYIIGKIGRRHFTINMNIKEPQICVGHTGIID